MVEALVGFRGAGIPSIVSNAHVQNGASTFSLIHPGIASAAVGDMLFSVANARSSALPWEGRTFTPASGWTKVVDLGTTSTTAVNPYVFSATKPVTVAGAQAGVTHTVNDSSVSYFGSMIYIPAGAAPASLTATPSSAVVPGTNIVLSYTGTGTLTQTAGPTATIVATTSSSATVRAPYTVNGTTLTFSRGGATASVQVLKATRRLVVTGGANPVEVPLAHLFVTADDLVVTPTPVTGIQSFVMANRSLYPGANPDFNHMAKPLVDANTLRIIPADQGGWPLVYWTRANSTWTPGPNDKPGYVYRADRYFDPERNAGLKAYVGPDLLVQVDCRHDGPINVPAGQEPGGRFLGAVFYGLHPRLDQWTDAAAREGAKLYRTRADADAMTNAVPRDPRWPNSNVRPGIWYLNPTEVPIDPNDQHTVMVKAQRGTLAAGSGKAFRAYEGLHLGGDFAGEFNWSGGADSLLVLSAMHIQRVSVYMQPDSANKRQGDGIQLFGGLAEVACRGLTIAATNYQAIFNQMTQNGVTPLRNVWTDVDVRWDLSDAVNGSTSAAGVGPQMFTGPDINTVGMIYEVERVNLDPGLAGGRSRSRSQLIGGTHPGVNIVDLSGVPYTIPANQVGANYIMPEEL
jgi:hypothetical protein